MFPPTTTNRKLKGGNGVKRLTKETTEIVAQKFEESPSLIAARAYVYFVNGLSRLDKIYFVLKIVGGLRARKQGWDTEVNAAINIRKQ